MSLERITMEALIKIILLIGGVMTAAAYLVLVERWIAAWVQMRRGPNRVGVPLTKIRLFGLGQPLADGLKFIFKEEYIPAHVNRPLYVLAPILVLATALAVFAVIPFGSVIPSASAGSVEWQEPIPLIVAPGIDVGIIFVFALASLAVYGVILGGWASNNKYSFLGGLRSSAQLISYELSLGLGILGVVLASGSLRLDEMIHQQARTGWWNALTQPLGFMVFVTAAFAEAARLPFDLPEAEQELIGGYHTEYSGIKLLLFLVGEFIHMITAAVLIVILFLGGWHFWGMSGPGEAIGWGEAILRIIVLNVKVLAVILFFMLVRWTWPRFRFDQLMALGWKVMLPLGILNLLAVAFLEEWYFGRPEMTRLVYVAIGWAVLLGGWSAVAWAAPKFSDNSLKSEI
jgi:NADH-quinone oxidoreductase subunit H